MNLRETKMKLEVRTLGDYSLHVILPKKECENIKKGDLIEVGIGEKTPTAQQPGDSELIKRVKALEDYVHPILKAKEEASEANKAREKAEKEREVKIANRDADNSEGYTRADGLSNP